MILHLFYISRNLDTSNEVRFKPICLLLDLSTTNLYIRYLYYLVNTLISIESIIRLITLIKLTFA